jgi:hypothetical protein
MKSASYWWILSWNLLFRPVVQSMALSRSWRAFSQKAGGFQRVEACNNALCLVDSRGFQNGHTTTHGCHIMLDFSHFFVDAQEVSQPSFWDNYSLH